jgi:hypothetical protein
MDGNDVLEPTTTELLSREWDEIYGVLAQINDFLKSKPQEARELLVRNPRFTRALFQAQLQLGIAYLSTGISADDSPMTSPMAVHIPQQMVPQMSMGSASVASVINDAELSAVLRAMTLEEFKKLDPTTQNDFMLVRKGLGLPPIPTQ